MLVNLKEKSGNESQSHANYVRVIAESSLHDRSMRFRSLPSRFMSETNSPSLSDHPIDDQFLIRRPDVKLAEGREKNHIFDCVTLSSRSTVQKKKLDRFTFISVPSG